MTIIVSTYIYKNYYYPHAAILELYSRLAKEYKYYNLIISPFSEGILWKGKIVGYIATCKICTQN